MPFRPEGPARRPAGPAAAPAAVVRARGDGLPDLTVAFSTRGRRALGLDPGAWPATPGLDYLVLVQEPAADPGLAGHLAAIAARPDAAVVELATTGLARSRNAALDHACGAIVLVADDDVTHLPGAFDGVRRFFAENPGVDLLVGRSLNPDGSPRRRVTGARPLTLWNAGRTSSHELAFRRAPVNAAGIRFDERFGVGAGTPAHLGEEYIFIADCLGAGLRGAHRPLDLTVHSVDSSGHHWGGSAQARAAVLARIFGRAAPVARVGFALKNLRRFATAGDFLRFLRG